MGPCMNDEMAAFTAIFIALIVLFAVIIKILIVWIFCRIFSKAGFSWALGLLMLVPIANIVMPLILAFSEWPIQKELRELKQKLTNTPVQS